MTVKQKKKLIMSAIIACKNGSCATVKDTYDLIENEGYLKGLLTAFELVKTVDTLEMVVINKLDGSEYIRWERTK